ncbi:MAG: amidohydrolase family protein, partial [Candidatus Binatia bacterium]
EEKKRKLADPAVRQQMIAEQHMVVTDILGGPFDGLTIQRTQNHPELKRYLGKTVGEVARAEGKHPLDAMLDVALAGDLEVEFRTPEVFSTDAEKVAEMLRSPYVLPGVSDGGAHVKFFPTGTYTTDMLAWLVRDTEKLTLEDAHYHLSSLPAQAAGFRDRGTLREGAPADIVVYDLEKLGIVPRGDYEVAHDLPAGEWRRIQRAEGYRWILVNGEITFEDGRCTGATPGKLLRHGKG